MDEFLVAIMSGIALICYTFLNKLLFESTYQVYFRWGLFLFIVMLIVAYILKRRWDKKHLTKMGIDAENYMFYEKYTSEIYAKNIENVYKSLVQRGDN